MKPVGRCGVDDEASKENSISQHTSHPPEEVLGVTAATTLVSNLPHCPVFVGPCWGNNFHFLVIRIQTLLSGPVSHKLLTSRDLAGQGVVNQLNIKPLPRDVPCWHIEKWKLILCQPLINVPIVRDQQQIRHPKPINVTIKVQLLFIRRNDIQECIPFPFRCHSIRISLIIYLLTLNKF